MFNWVLNTPLDAFVFQQERLLPYVHLKNISTVCCSKTLINNILLIIMRFKSSRSQMFFKIGVLFLNISKYLQEKACAESLFNCMPCLQLYRKETPIQAFSCEYCAIRKNIFFYRTLPVVASGV